MSSFDLFIAVAALKHPHIALRQRSVAQQSQFARNPLQTQDSEARFSGQAIPPGPIVLQTTPTVFSRALGWISFWLITTVCGRKRSTIERT